MSNDFIINIMERIGWIIEEELVFIPINISPEALRHLENVKRDNERAKMSLENKDNLSS